MSNSGSGARTALDNALDDPRDAPVEDSIFKNNFCKWATIFKFGVFYRLDARLAAKERRRPRCRKAE